jgi:hypothetical protein
LSAFEGDAPNDSAPVRLAAPVARRRRPINFVLRRPGNDSGHFNLRLRLYCLGWVVARRAQRRLA